MQVRFGSSKASEGGITYYVSRSAPHPSYNSANIDYDIAYLELSNEVAQTAAIRAIDLASEEPRSGAIGTVTGYGVVNSQGQLADQLQVLNVPVIDRDECRSVVGGNLITDRMVCAGDLKGQSSPCNVSTCARQRGN